MPSTVAVDTMSELERHHADLASHHIEGYTSHGQHRVEVPLVSHVVDDLWVGGCLDGVRLPDDFSYVLALYDWERFEIGDTTTRVTVPMLDLAEEPDEAQVRELAQWVNDRRHQGRTLVHCQAGLNRSSLVVAYALMLDGMRAADAIALLRERRCDAVLCNPVFEAWLLARDSVTETAREPESDPAEPGSR